MPYYRTSALEQVDYSALTHLMASFLQPGNDAKFTPDSDITAIINAAKKNGIQAYVAIGGGGTFDPSFWLNLMSAQNAQATAQSIVDAALSLKADGIDVDLEGDLVMGGSYNEFVAVLAATAKANNLGLSAALAKYTCSQAITDDTLELFDFINMMAYDYKGAWDTNEPLSDFSSYEVSQNELDYYINTRGQAGSKMTLGVPFYGYDFSNKKQVTAFTWAQLVSENPGQIDNDNYGGRYYNGRQTIKAKTLLAQSYGAGMMIWELGQDVPSPSENSLLTQIKMAMAEEKVAV